MKYLLSIFLASSLLIIGCSHKQPKGSNGESLQDDPNEPKISTPVVKKVWIEPRIDGDKYYSGHYMFVLERGSVWTKP